MKARLSIPDGAELQLRDGTVVGRVTSITVELDLDALGGLRGGSSSSLDNSSEAMEGREKPPPTPNDDSQTALLPDPVEETWQLYTELLSRPRVKLTPKVRRWIADAHKACGVDRTRQAIRGLAQSDHHRQNGYIGIEYAIKPKQSETIEGRIEMMAAKASVIRGNGETTVDRLIAHLSSESQVMVRQWVEDIKQGLRYQENRGLVATAEARIADLRDKLKIEPVIEGGAIVDWKDLS